MWPFLSHTLFPPPTKAWLQSVSTDSEAQGWGAWSRAQKPPLGPGDGDRKEEEPGETEGDQEDGDAGFLLSLVAGEDLAEYPAPDQVTPTGSPVGAGQGPQELVHGFRGTDGCSHDPLPGHCP